MKVKKICLKCGEVNEVGEEDILQIWVHDEYADSFYRIMLYRCGRCNASYLLQVDNKKTLDIKKKLLNALFKAHDRKEYDRLNERLDVERKRLYEYVSGIKLYNESGEKVDFLEEKELTI